MEKNFSAQHYFIDIIVNHCSIKYQMTFELVLRLDTEIIFYR